MKFRFINVLDSVMSYMSFEFMLNRYLKVVYKNTIQVCGDMLYFPSKRSVIKGAVEEYCEG